MSAAATFPFTAIVGQEQLKLALLLNAINPACGGALLLGERGTAKSTAVRALGRVAPGLRVVTLPLNATEDRVVGSLDMTRAIREGRKHLERGLLAAADGQILYIDEVNLLSESIVSAILDAVSSGVNVVEREGISERHASRFVLVGSMNPEEGQLRPQLLDRFGLCVVVGGEGQLQRRTEIIRRRLAFEAHPARFAEGYGPRERILRDRIVAARESFPCISLPEETIDHIARVASDAHVAGHRADLVLAEAARALAAWQGETQVTPAHVNAVAPLVLVHRMREEPECLSPIPPKPERQQPEEPPENDSAPEQEGQNPEPPSRDEGLDAPAQDPAPDESGSDAGADSPDDSGEEDQVFEVGDGSRTDGLLPVTQDRVFRRRGSGRRCRTRTHTPMGRYVRHALPRGRAHDLAFDATLRAAAPWQMARGHNGLAISVRGQDLRIKVRERRTGYTILFLVDASGSMGAERRMATAKGAIFSLLQEAYQKRDTVGMVTFRRSAADLALPPTRSIDHASRLLQELPTGGRTPLALGICRAIEIVRGLRIKDPQVLPVVVLISDWARERRAARRRSGGGRHSDGTKSRRRGDSFRRGRHGDGDRAAAHGPSTLRRLARRLHRAG